MTDRGSFQDTNEELDRLTRQHDSLVKIETNQQLLITKLSDSEL